LSRLAGTLELSATITDLEFTQNHRALLWSENPGERAGLSQLRPAFVWRGENAEQFVHRAIDQCAPFNERGARSFGAVWEPAFEVSARVLNERWVGPQLFGDQSAKCEATLIDEAVVFHLVTRRRWLKAELETRTPWPLPALQ